MSDLIPIALAAKLVKRTVRTLERWNLETTMIGGRRHVSHASAVEAMKVANASNPTKSHERAREVQTVRRLQAKHAHHPQT